MLIGRNDLAISILVKNWIQDLANAGMSYSRISVRLNLSSSTIQKIATKNRIPHFKNLKVLGNYYLKIFENPEHYGTSVETYFSENHSRICEVIQKTKALIKLLSC